MKHVALNLLLLWPALAWGGPRVYVHSRADLGAHFRLHIARVQSLGLALHDAHPEAFPGVTRRQVVEFLSLHDRAKLGRLNGLYSIYGVGYEPQSAEVRARVARVVGELNEEDTRIRESYLARLGETAAESLYRLERIADVVDRNTDPVAREEFAIGKGRDPPLSAYLKDTGDLDLATALKARYADLVGHLAYTRCPFAALR